MGNDVRQAALDYLANHQVMTLATQGNEGLWAAAVFYVHDGFSFYFLSAGHTRHARNIASQPRVAATIQEDYRDWADIKGIQLAGIVTQLRDDGRYAAIDLYLQKYPFVGEGNSQLQNALDKVNWYKLEADRLYFIDNSKGLGHRDEIELV